MLHYLVTYARETQEKGASLTLLGDGSTAAQPGTSSAKPSTPGTSVHRADGSTTAEDRVGEPPHFPTTPLRSGSTALVWLVTAALACDFTGCACFRRDKVDAKVVSARQMSLQGIDALQRGQWDDAQACFAGALRQNPADERAHHHYAEVLWHQGDLPGAIKHQEESVRLSGGDASLLVQLGEMYLQHNNIDAASECAEEALDLHRQMSGAWALRGDIHRRRGEPTEALECYHRALNYQPHYPHVQMAVAEMYQTGGKPRRALATLEALANNYHPNDLPPNVDFQRGIALKSLGRYQDAAEALAKATERGEPSAEWWFQLSEAEFLAGNMAPARVALHSALNKSPTHSASLQLRDRMARQSESLTASLSLERKTSDR